MVSVPLVGGRYEIPRDLNQLTDGTSNTAAFSEYIRGNGSGTPATCPAGLGLIYTMAFARMSTQGWLT